MRLFLPFTLLICWLTIGFSQHEYDIAVHWKGDENPLDLHHNITWQNTSEIPVASLFLLDWNHAYSSEFSPLGLFLANEFDYKLIRAGKNKRGFTTIKSIYCDSGSLSWRRLPDQLDVIEIILPKPIAPGDKFIFSADYSVQLPDKKLFHFGIEKDLVYVHHWHLLLGELGPTGLWTLTSNLGFNQPHSPKAETHYNFDLPDYINKVLPINEEGTSSLFLTTSNSIQTIPFGSSKLITDMVSKESFTPELELAITDIADFLGDYFPAKKTQYAFQIDYSQHSILGLTSLPQFLGGFSKAQVTELSLLKLLLRHSIISTYGVQEEESAWLLDGLTMYLWQRYVDINYPNMLMMGNLNKWPIVKKYHFTQAPFYRTWEIATNVSTNKNRGQALTTPPQLQTRYNRRIANPNRAGLALLYLDAYLGDNMLADVIKTLPRSPHLAKALHAALVQKTEKPVDWFFDQYIAENNNDDAWIKAKKINDTLHQITVSSTKQQMALPLSIFLKNGTSSTQWIKQSDLPYSTTLNQRDVASVTLNAKHLIPELRLSNNGYRTDRFIFRNNLRLRLIQDIPKTGTAILLVAPEIGYNLYDGLLGGIKVGNSSLLGNTFRYEFTPMYGANSKKLNGMGYVITNLYHENSPHFLTRITLFGSSYHYAPKLRYATYSPSVEFFYRPKGIQQNHRSSLLLRHVSVRLQDLPEDDDRRSYGVSVASFESRQGDALKNLSYKSELQWADPFKKLSAETQYTHYYLPNRRWAFRAFGGVFLQNNSKDSYFDFNASRVNDYLFQYDLYGRSESDGLFSQQYIREEGGLRTVGDRSSANQWLISTQASTTLLHWFEAYAEIGWIKDSGQKATTHWGTGVTLNIIPDFFEIHFPVYDATGNLMTKHAYPSQIRFQLSLRPASLVRLFSRSWF